MKVLIFLASLLFSSVLAIPSSSTSAIDPQAEMTNEEYLNLVAGSLCDNTTIAVELMQKTDECILNSNMKRAIGDCRAIAYGSDDQWQAKDLYCASGKLMRDEMDELFNFCLLEQGLDVESIQAEYIANCGFCENPELVLKTESCFSEGEIKEKWLECREEIFSTRDAIEAAAKYCAGDREARLAQDQVFDECLFSKSVTREAFDEALQQC